MNSLPIYGILNENHSDMVEYYLKKYTESGLKIVNLLLISVEDAYPFNDKESVKNVIITYNGHLIEKLIFSDNQLILPSEE